MSQSIQNHSILSLCARIQASALTCDDYHVFVDYSGHTGTLTVCVRDCRMDYSAPTETWPEPLLYERVYLDAYWSDPIAYWSDPIAELTEIVDQLQRLGIDV